MAFRNAFRNRVRWCRYVALLCCISLTVIVAFQNKFVDIQRHVSAKQLLDHVSITHRFVSRFLICRTMSGGAQSFTLSNVRLLVNTIQSQSLMQLYSKEVFKSSFQTVRYSASSLSARYPQHTLVLIVSFFCSTSQTLTIPTPYRSLKSVLAVVDTFGHFNSQTDNTRW